MQQNPMVPQEINGYIQDACIGWKHQVGLEEGIQNITTGFIENIERSK
jgi:hypothetical protein